MAKAKGIGDHLVECVEASGMNLQDTIWSWTTHEMARGHCEGGLRKAGPLQLSRWAQNSQC